MGKKQTSPVQGNSGILDPNQTRDAVTGEPLRPIDEKPTSDEEAKPEEKGQKVFYDLYRKKALQPMRPYVPGEDLTGISVSPEDTPAEGGMIAINPQNPADKWYIAQSFFQANYEMEESETKAEPVHEIPEDLSALFTLDGALTHAKTAILHLTKPGAEQAQAIRLIDEALQAAKAVETDENEQG